METLIDAPSIDKFMVAEENPEVMLDVLTMQSLRDRYNETDILEINLTAPYVNEQDFDNYVREFVIDDAISECFASEDTSSAVSFPFQKMQNSPVKQNRLKKKLVHKSPQEEMILSDDESRSSDSKRSKLIGHIFNRKQKGKENMKPIKDSEEKENDDITGAIIDACEHITKTYKHPQNSGKVDSTISEKLMKREPKTQGIIQNGSISKDYNNIGRQISIGNRSRDSSSSRRLPPIPNDSNRSDSSVSRRKHSTASSTGTSRRTPKKTEALIDELMSKTDGDLATTIPNIPYDALRKTRDKSGNTVLHRCVKEDKSTSVKILSTKYPQMCSELNNDRLSALEYSVKLGKCECMSILLEKSRSDGVLESLTVPRLLNMAAEYDQTECIVSLLNLLPKTEGRPLELPPDSMGNTAAHEAASKGHLSCLKILLDDGYDVWSKNSDGLSPIQLAIHNKHAESYGYMLLFESSRCLAREATHHYNKAIRLQNSKMSNYDAFMRIESQLSRYQEQLNEAMRETLESQENILVALDCIQDQLAIVLGSIDDPSDISCNLETIKGESERLQDLFDFSVISNANSMLSKLLTDFREVLKDADGKMVRDEVPDSTPYHEFRMSYKDLHAKIAHGKGENFSDEVKKHVSTFLESHKVREVNPSDKESTTNSSSNNSSNRTFTITKKSLKLPSFTASSSNDFPSQSKEEFSCRENTIIEPPPEFSNSERKENLYKKLSKGKRSDISSGRSKPLLQKQSKVIGKYDGVHPNGIVNQSAANVISSPEVPLLESPSATESVYTSTLTSDHTVTDQFSDWTSRTETLGRPSDSGSEWWNEHREFGDDNNADDEEENRVRLNVDNEDLSDDMLRQHRLKQHLKSVEKINNHRSDVIETVVTASGRQLGRANPSKVPKPAPRLSLNNEPTKHKQESKRVTNIFSKLRNKNKVKLFSAEDVSPSREITETEFMESYDRSRDSANSDLKWDEVSLTDGEEYKTNEKPWYEMSEDEESLIQGWKTDDEDESRELGAL